jgi:cellulose synthase/poly-beta-1,6-N-acetylglucosamine synthase-like glycosyltransferase
MKKITVIILTIISTLISVIFIVLSYFGITRYISLRRDKSKKLIEQYKTLSKASDSNKVIISFTTTLQNIDRIRPMINSILDQTVRVDQIILVLPYGSTYNIPEYLKEIVTIVPTGKNYGEGTKLIPTLLREKECDTIIIAINDNKIYGKDFIETLVEEANKNPNTVLIDKCNSTILVRPEYFGCDIIDRDKDTFTNDWFLEKAKNSKVICYSENYTLFK